MADLKNQLTNGVKEIAGREVGWTENLFGSAVDSMSLVGIINLVEQIADETGVSVDIDALISEDSLTIKDLHEALTNGK